TANFLREDHELHAAYEQVMKQLLQLPDFRNLLAISRKLPIHINLPQNTGAPFYTCRVILPWPLSHNIALDRTSTRLNSRPPYHFSLPNQHYSDHNANLLLEDHELHAAYEQVMKQLLQLPDFRNLLAISRKLPIHINLPQNTGAPFYTCRVILPWPLSHKIA